MDFEGDPASKVQPKRAIPLRIRFQFPLNWHESGIARTLPMALP